MDSKAEKYLFRCAELALLGGTAVAPNPKVGAVVVCDGRIIGEGWHAYFGGAHAEVNAIQAVHDKSLLSRSTLYVSLEPCNHLGKTPACTKLILENRIPHVVIGMLDPNPRMQGKSVAALRDAGVKVEIADDHKVFEQLNKHFIFNQKHQRPYLTLKWAESGDGYIAGLGQDGNPLRKTISHPENRRLVHELRAKHQAILVGRKTVETDKPLLNLRYFPGKNPVKIIWDNQLVLNRELPLFKEGKIIVLNRLRERTEKDIWEVKIGEGDSLQEVLERLYAEHQIGSILVEGGTRVLTSFLHAGTWEECIVLQSPDKLGNGLFAPQKELYENYFQSVKEAFGDLIFHYKHSNHI